MRQRIAVEWSEFLSCRDTVDESHETIPLDHALQPLCARVCKGCNAARLRALAAPTPPLQCGRSIVAPESPPTPISYRLARSSRRGSYWAVITEDGRRVHSSESSSARAWLGGTLTTRAQKRLALAIALVIDETPEWALSNQA